MSAARPKYTQVYSEGEWIELGEYAVPDRCFGWQAAGFTRQAYGPVTVVVWWEKAHPHPLFLVATLELVEEVCSLDRRRLRMETFFSDQKSRGFAIDKSHISDPDRLLRVLMAACLAYIWMIYRNSDEITRAFSVGACLLLAPRLGAEGVCARNLRKLLNR